MTLSGKDVRKLAKASALSHSNDPKDQDRARARKTDVDYKDLIRQLKAKRMKKVKEDWKPEIEVIDTKKERRMQRRRGKKQRVVCLLI